MPQASPEHSFGRRSLILTQKILPPMSRAAGFELKYLIKVIIQKTVEVFNDRIEFQIIAAFVIGTLFI